MVFNYHTHTSFCDGRDTPAEMAEAALQLHMTELGFSGHSFTQFDTGWCMSRENTKQYQSEVRGLQRQYAGKMNILLGIEQDFYSEEPTAEYDYVIGSVHYLFRDGVYLPIDESREAQEHGIHQHYGGDYYAYAEDYFQTVASIYEKTGCRIVGHFDLLTKFNENGNLFDTDNPRYRAAALNALETLSKAPVVFELNTGAMSRGYRSEPYPEKWILDWLHDHDCKVLFSSDCHDKRHLLCGYETYRKNINCDRLTIL